MIFGYYLNRTLAQAALADTLPKPVQECLAGSMAGTTHNTVLATMAGVRCPHNFRFLYLNLSCGISRNWSVLAFRFGTLPSPPIPATAQALTLAASFLP